MSAFSVLDAQELLTGFVVSRLSKVPVTMCEIYRHQVRLELREVKERCGTSEKKSDATEQWNGEDSKMDDVKQLEQG